MNGLMGARFAAFLALGAAAAAPLGTPPGPARLIADINATPTEVAGAFPDNFTALGAITLFTARAPDTGLELWRTDGTEAGTLLVKDIRPGPSDSGPAGLIALHGEVLFHADDGIHGRELWKTDGTAAGTGLVADIWPGPDGSLASYSQAGILGDSAYFDADDGIHGRELWKSDGTAGGTALVKDIDPRPGRSGGVGALPPTAVGGVLLFAAGDGDHGVELWKTDGTEAGTALVKDIQPGPIQSLPGGGFGFVFDTVKIGETLYFLALDATHGLAPWRSDGTEAGTWLVKDVDPDAGIDIMELAEAGGTLFVTAEHGDHGPTLWRSDGTEAGTVLVQDFGGWRPSELTGFRGRLYFSLGDAEHGEELWSSDGTASGAGRIKDIASGPDSSHPSQFFEAGATLYFTADDGDHGTELWKSDGTESGTVLVHDIDPGFPSSIPFNNGPVLRAGSVHGLLLLAAEDGVHGVELWKSDGTERGTALVRDVNPTVQTRGAGGDPLGVIDGVMLFRTYDGVHGAELWRTDGTRGGTALVKDIAPGPQSSDPGLGVVVGKTVFFTAFDSTHGRELWKSDGTEEGTVLVRDIAGSEEDNFPRSSFLRSLTPQAGLLFFIANDGVHGFEPWRSDGTEAGTFLLEDITPGLGTSFPGSFQTVGDAVVFPASDPAHGLELWRSDGTENGTSMLGDLNPGPSSSLGEVNYAAMGGSLFFPATDGVHGTELWRTDGTPAGTYMVKDALPGTTDPLLFRARTVVGNTLFFVASEFNSAAALWKSDGTEAGTVQVKSGIRLGETFFYHHLVAARGALFFDADDGVHGVELWTSDGTEAGTRMVADIQPGSGDGIAARRAPPFLFGTAGRLFFFADDGIHGEEPWTSDGTEAGTRLTRDVRPGIESSLSAPSLTVGDTLLFRADDGVHGAEPWRTDGTPEGTVLIQDIAPGPDTSSAIFVLDGTIAGSRIPFRADDGVAGWELWAGRAGILAGQPQRALEDLRTEVGRLHLPPGIARGLARTLDAASVPSLDRFLRKVERLSPAQISDEERANLLEFGEDLVTLLETP